MTGVSGERAACSVTGVHPAIDGVNEAIASDAVDAGAPALTAEPAPAERRMSRSIVLTSGGQAAAMATGGLMAILIASRFGSSGRTDGFFAAYSVYGLVLLIAQSTRLTVVPRLIRGETRYAPFNRYLLGLGVLWLGCGIVFVPLGGPLASLLTGSHVARSTARDAFLVLWPAAGAQLVAALGAAMLGVLGRFGQAAGGYVAGSLSTVVAFLVLAGPLGVDAVAVALLIGSVVTAMPVLWGLLAAGWRPQFGAARHGAARRAGLMLVGAASVAAPQLQYVIAMAAAPRLGAGAPTSFSYGFLGTQVLVSVLAGSVSIVAAAPIATGWDRDPASLSPVVGRGFRLAVLILVPVIAGVALVGPAVAAPVLSGFGSHHVDDVIGAFLAMTPAILAAIATAVPLVALYALHRHAEIACLAIVVALLQAGLAAAAVTVGGIVELGLATSVSSLTFAAGLYGLLYRRDALHEGAARVADLVRVGLLPAACFAIPWVAGARGALAFVLGLVLFSVALVVTRLPARAGLSGWRP